MSSRRSENGRKFSGEGNTGRVGGTIGAVRKFAVKRLCSRDVNLELFYLRMLLSYNVLTWDTNVNINRILYCNIMMKPLNYIINNNYMFCFCFLGIQSIN
jgi:hypothetical protein